MEKFSKKSEQRVIPSATRRCVLRIGVDIDGTICNFSYAFCSIAWEVFGYKTRWKELSQGVHRTQFLEVYDYMIRENVFLSIQPYAGAVDTLKSWKAQGHEIVYITRRRPGNDQNLLIKHETQTKLWIVQNHFPPGDVIFTQDKLDYCEANAIPILVEDYLKDALEWTGAFFASSGTRFRVYLIDRPWNQGDYPHRIKDLSAVEVG